jgi:hypothetical protein
MEDSAESEKSEDSAAGLQITPRSRPEATLSTALSRYTDGDCQRDATQSLTDNQD